MNNRDWHPFHDLISEELAGKLDEGVVATGEIGIGLLDIISGSMPNSADWP